VASNERDLVPEPIDGHVRACIDYVRRAVGVELDFTPETLPVLDHYASTVRPEIESRPELLLLATNAMGAYFGEVVRGRIPGFWRLPSANVHDWSVCCKVVFLSFNPIGVAHDATFRSSDHEGPRSMLRVAAEDREYLSRRLETLPPVPEDEYFLFSTRFEVIEVAAEALHARLEESGYSEVEYTEEDYESELLRPL
jgi:hypothetical protein